MGKSNERKTGSNARTLGRILRYIRPYGGLVALSLVLSLLTVGLTLYVPILTGRGVDAIVGTGQVDFTALLAVIAGIVISVAVTALAQWIMSHITCGSRPLTTCRPSPCPMWTATPPGT